MPLFIDVHTIDGEVVTETSRRRTRESLRRRAGTRARTRPSGSGEKAGRVFWLVEVPSAKAAQAVHRRTHGPVISKIYEVKPDAPWFPI